MHIKKENNDGVPRTHAISAQSIAILWFDMTLVMSSALRERKDALLKLFDAVALWPQAGASVKGKDTRGKLQTEVRQSLVKHSGINVKEIVADGEEIEVDGAEVATSTCSSCHIG